jgi:8-oxo-dGTP pyrophosphatase MutT (NUDIX family)
MGNSTTRNMNPTLRIAVVIIGTYILVVSAISSAMGIYTYFTGDQLKTAFGSYWWIYVFVLPALAVAAVLLYQNLIKRSAANWEARINNYLTDVKIYGTVSEEPVIEIVGRYELNEGEQKLVTQQKFKVNDIHGMVADEPMLLHSPVILSARTLSYGTLELLRQSDRHQYILSSAVVLVCPKREVLIVHHRSLDSRTYPDAIHTIGGAFQPSVDRNSLKRTAHREVDEETEASVLVEDEPLMMLSLERSTRFLQLVFLGASISTKQCDNLRGNWEAEGIIKIPFRDLRRHLTEPVTLQRADGTVRVIDWVPSGKAHVLAWLANGAPGAGTRPTFGGLSPLALFEEIVGSG